MWELFSAVWLLFASRSSGSVSDLPAQLITFIYRPHFARSSIFNANSQATQEQEKLLASMERQGFPRDKHGLWMQTQNGELLAEYQSKIPIPAASLTKIATSLVAIHEWGLNHRFNTRLITNGQIIGDTLQGDLIIVGGVDPFFIWEDAIVVGNRLNQLGIKKISGDLIIQNKFSLNFEQDHKKVKELFAMAIDQSKWQGEIIQQFNNLPKGTPKPNVVITNQLKTAPSQELKELLSYQSVPLWQIIKNMNVYSNNGMAEILAQQLGGANQLAQKTAQLAGVPVAEIQLINGSGLGNANRISPRAVVAMLISLQNMVQNHGFSVADLMPVAGCNCGTIAYRELPKGAVVKTGTLIDVSALAGVIQTQDRGIVWFAILNQGEGELANFHKVQDDLLNNVTKQWQTKSYYFEREWQRFRN